MWQNWALYPDGVNKRSSKQQSDAEGDLTAASAFDASATDTAAADGPTLNTAVFDRAAAERVMHRAVQLATDEDSELSADGISERALIEAATELGVSASVVQQAAAEERVGLLVQPYQRGDSLVGPAIITVSRIVPGPPQDVLDAVDSWLRKTVSLRRLRRDDSCASYSRRTDLAATAERTVRSLTGTEDVPRVRLLRVSTTALASSERGNPQSTLVVLQTDLSGERSTAVGTGAVLAVLGTVISAVAAVTMGGIAQAAGLLLLGIPASCVLGLSILFLRSRGLAQVEESLQAILDRVATGKGPGSKLTRVVDKLFERISSFRSVQSRPEA